MKQVVVISRSPFEMMGEIQSVIPKESQRAMGSSSIVVENTIYALVPLNEKYILGLEESDEVIFITNSFPTNKSMHDLMTKLAELSVFFKAEVQVKDKKDFLNAFIQTV